MKICVLGGDGYCGWATALYLSRNGHAVAVVDNFLRRQWDFELGAQSLTPIQPLTDRLRVWQELTGKSIELFIGDVNDYDFLSGVIESFPAGCGGSLCRAAIGAVFDDRPQTCGVYPSQ